MSRFMLAGTRSGCGKTTVTLAVLAALKRRGEELSAFKCGPDYIDSGFHKKAIGVKACNLDSFFCQRDTLLYLLEKFGSRVNVIEGVMGFYDGGEASAHSLSLLTDTPAVIVIDCKGMGESIGAVMSGYLNYRRQCSIAGFIFNRLSPRLAPMAKGLCEEMGVRYLGFMPKAKNSLESRHLGLITAEETGDIQLKLNELADLAEEHILLDELLRLGGPLPSFTPPATEKISGRPVIAVAKDRAFCFIYDEGITLLEDLGCEVKFFSPISDSALPHCDGLVLCGGYPELHAKALSENLSMLKSIRGKITGGLPVIAECGGFMYLHERLATDDGEFKMAGVIEGRAYPVGRLTRFGYNVMTANEDNLLCPKGGRVKAHEFHYFDSDSCGEGFTARKNDGRSWQCAHVSETMYAGFGHIYPYSDIETMRRFALKCAEYGDRNG